MLHDCMVLLLDKQTAGARRKQKRGSIVEGIDTLARTRLRKFQRQNKPVPAADDDEAKAAATTIGQRALPLQSLGLQTNDSND